MIDFFKKIGVEKIFMGAGDRNAPLIDSLNLFEIKFGLNEQSLAFEALGYAKITGKPVAVCTTSGTAVAQCLPAVIEAYYSGEKLIIISADRPLELRHTRSAQTIDQSNLFGPYVRSKFDGTAKELKGIEESFPMHINIQVPKESLIKRVTGDFATQISRTQKPLAIFTTGSEDFEKEYELLKSLGFDIFNEIHSGLKKKPTIKYDHTLLDIMKNNPYDLIIKFGATPLSKLWRVLNSEFQDTAVYSYRNEFGGCLGARPIDDLSLIDKKLKWVPELLNEKEIEALFLDLPVSEIAVVQGIIKKLQPDDILYLGNSMPIRYADFFSPIEQKVFANRGVNGIDGQLETAVGLAEATEKNVVAILGDLTFQYSGQYIWEEIPSNLTIHILNNNGGRIFERVATRSEMLLIHQNSYKELFDSECVIEHEINLEQTRLFWDRLNG